jgi:hypothetical protein
MNKQENNKANDPLLDVFFEIGKSYALNGERFPLKKYRRVAVALSAAFRENAESELTFVKDAIKSAVTEYRQYQHTIKQDISAIEESAVNAFSKLEALLDQRSDKSDHVRQKALQLFEIHFSDLKKKLEKDRQLNVLVEEKFAKIESVLGEMQSRVAERHAAYVGKVEENVEQMNAINKGEQLGKALAYAVKEDSSKLVRMFKNLFG